MVRGISRFALFLFLGLLFKSTYEAGNSSCEAKLGEHRMLGSQMFQGTLGEYYCTKGGVKYCSNKPRDLSLSFVLAYPSPQMHCQEEHNPGPKGTQKAKKTSRNNTM